MAGATPAHFVVALGKDGNLYLLDRDNLGGKGGAVSISGVANSEINGAPAVYTTGQGTYVAFRSNGTAAGCPQAGFAPGNMAVAKVTSGGTPPTASVVWCAAQSNLGSPIVTTTAAGDVIVWDANDHLYAYDGDTGALVYGGGGASDGMADSIQYFNTTIAAKGRIVAGAGNQVYVFRP
jgi:hypothetical protein